MGTEGAFELRWIDLSMVFRRVGSERKPEQRSHYFTLTCRRPVTSRAGLHWDMADRELERLFPADLGSWISWASGIAGGC